MLMEQNLVEIVHFLKVQANHRLCSGMKFKMESEYVEQMAEKLSIKRFVI